MSPVLSQCDKMKDFINTCELSFFNNKLFECYPHFSHNILGYKNKFAFIEKLI